MKCSEETKQLLEDIFVNYPEAAACEARLREAAAKLLALDGEPATDINIAGALEGVAYSLRAAAVTKRQHGAPLNVTFRKCPETAEELAAAAEIIGAQAKEDAVETDDSPRYFRAIPVGSRYAIGTVDLCGDLMIDFVDELLPDDLGFRFEDYI